jgi:hypothetical protein
MICPNIELDLDVLGAGRLAAGSVLASLSGSISALGNAVDASEEADGGMGLMGPQAGDFRCCPLALALLGEVGNGVSDGDVDVSEGLGSMNEKKLCERECLWWCPRRVEGPFED